MSEVMILGSLGKSDKIRTPAIGDQDDEIF